MLDFAHSQLSTDQVKGTSFVCEAMDPNTSTQIEIGNKVDSRCYSANEHPESNIFSHHNYCNIGPVLGDVVSMSKDYLPPPPPELLMMENHEQCPQVIC